MKKRTEVMSKTWERLATYPDILVTKVGREFYVGQTKYVVHEIREVLVTPDDGELLVIIVEGPVV